MPWPLGEERLPKSVTVARVTWLAKPAPDDPDAIERKEIAARLAQERTVRLGQEALEAVSRAASFESWLRIGKALMVGKSFAVAKAGNNWGQTYSKIFSAWIRRHHFDRIPAATRSVAIELAESADQITAWRDSLPRHQRKRLVHPLSVTRRWRALIMHNGGKSPDELVRDARAAWKRFVWCLRSLPAHEAAPLWQAALAEATIQGFNARPDVRRF